MFLKNYNLVMRRKDIVDITFTFLYPFINNIFLNFTFTGLWQKPTNNNKKPEDSCIAHQLYRLEVFYFTGLSLLS